MENIFALPLYRRSRLDDILHKKLRKILNPIGTAYLWPSDETRHKSALYKKLIYIERRSMPNFIHWQIRKFRAWAHTYESLFRGSLANNEISEIGEGYTRALSLSLENPGPQNRTPRKRDRTKPWMSTRAPSCGGRHTHRTKSRMSNIAPPPPPPLPAII